MKLDELKSTDWYKERPNVIKQAIEKKSPTETYVYGKYKQCFIYSYEEPESGKLEDVTCTIEFTGKGGILEGTNLEDLDKYQVYGVKLDDLIPLIN